MFPKNLKRIMKEKGVTGAALAEAAGFSKAAVSQYINGLNAPFTGTGGDHGQGAGGKRG